MDLCGITGVHRTCLLFWFGPAEKLSRIAIIIYLVHDYLIIPHQASPRGCFIGIDVQFCRKWAGDGLRPRFSRHHDYCDGSRYVWQFGRRHGLARQGGWLYHGPDKGYNACVHQVRELEIVAQAQLPAAPDQCCCYGRSGCTSKKSTTLHESYRQA